MAILRSVIALLVAAEAATAASLKYPTSEHVLKVRKSDGPSASSRHINKHISNLKARGNPSGGSRSSSFPYGLGSSTHLGAVKGRDFVAEIKIGGKAYDVEVDTGSSQLWLATEDYVCTDVNGTTIDRSECAMGPGYTGGFGGGELPDSNFYTTYGTDWYCSGKAGYNDVEIAGLTAKNQLMGLVDRMWFQNEGRASGIMGMEGIGTSIYKGTNQSTNGPDTEIDYDVMFTHLWKTNQTKPVFSLAQQRESQDGWLAFGGVPPVKVEGDYVTVPFFKDDIAGNGTGYEFYAFYNVPIESVIYTPAGGNSSQTRKIKRSDQQVITMNSSIVLDSGTDVIYFYEDVSVPILMSYDPPAQYNANIGNFAVPCNATPPEFGVKLGGKVFQIDPRDMIKQDKTDPETGVCATGVGIIDLPFTILGDAFLNNVVAVFDAQAGHMAFAQHVY